MLHRHEAVGLVRAAHAAVGVPVGRAARAAAVRRRRRPGVAGRPPLHLRVTSRPYSAAAVGARAARAHARRRCRAIGGVVGRPHGHDAAPSAPPDDGREGGLPRRPARPSRHQPPGHRGSVAPPGQHRARPAALAGRAGDERRCAARGGGPASDGAGDGVAAAALSGARAASPGGVVTARRRPLGLRGPAQLHRPGPGRAPRSTVARDGHESRRHGAHRAPRRGPVGGQARGDRGSGPGSRSLARPHRPAPVPGRVVLPVRRALRGRGTQAIQTQAAGRPRHAASLRRARPR